MTTRIVIPIEDETGLDAHVAEHFGRAPYFAVIDFENGKLIGGIKTEANTGEHFGGTGHPHEKLLSLKPNVIIAHGMGPGGLQSFRSARIIVLKADADTVKETVESFRKGKLTELTSGCEHAHHNEHDHSH